MSKKRRNLWKFAWFSSLIEREKEREKKKQAAVTKNNKIWVLRGLSDFIRLILNSGLEYIYL